MDKQQKQQKEYVEEPKEISDVLKENEEILWRGKPKCAAFIAGNFFGTLLLALLFGLFGGLLIFFCVQKGIFGGELSALTFILGAFLIVFFLPVYVWIFECLTAYLQYKHSEYVLTNKRVIAKKWRFGRYLEISDFRNVVNVNHAIKRVGRLFKVGDVVVECKKKKIVLRDLENPADTARELRRMIKPAKEEKVG